MNQWAFVIAAYAVFLIGVGGLLAWSLLTCRSAEDQAEKLSRRK
ncbi:heme exporter protein CcmD [Sphingomonas kaistensis]|uniref:Heme exporter protein D n=1 Tax=Sphingomonas kaistensis TaxID=298708 RepID=A0ABZ2G1V8_9SPHN